MLKRLGLVPIFAVSFGMVLLALLNVNVSWEAPFLLLLLNTLFISVIAFGIAYIAAVGYVRTGLNNLLLLGCAVLAFGLGGLIAAWVLDRSGGANLALIVYNTTALFSAMFHFTGTRLAPNRFFSGQFKERRRLALVLVYLGAAAFVVLLTWVGQLGLLPPFFLPGAGPTPLRQVVLGLSISLFFITAILLLRLYRRSGADLLYWYGLALILLAIGLLAVVALHTLNSPINWLGRLAQYLGGLYLLMAVLTVQRYRGMPLEMAVADFFRDAELNYRTLVDLATDAIVSFDRAGRVLLWNPAAERVFGYSQQEALGASLVDLIIPIPAAASWRQEIERLSRVEPNQPPGVFELKMVRQDGRSFPAELSLSTGQSHGMASTAIIRDVTERYQAQETLRRYTNRLEILREIDQAILLARLPEEIARAALVRLRDLIPCRRTSVLVFDFEQDEAVVLAVAMEGETQFGQGTRHALPDSPMLAGLLRGEPQIVPDLLAVPPSKTGLSDLRTEGIRALISFPLIFQGELVGALNLGMSEPGAFNPEQIEIVKEVAGVLAIAVQQAHLNELARSHTQELEERVADRTRQLRERVAQVEQLNQALTGLLEELQLSNSRLAETTRQLEEANAELEAFSYSVSHNLRAPLRALDGFARILQEDHGRDCPPEAGRYLALLRDNAQQMGQLIDDLLKFSRLSRQSLQKRKVDVTGLVHQVLDELKAGQGEERQVEVEMSQLPPGLADPALLKQVLLNLLANAFKFTRNREVARIEIGSTQAEGETVYYVRDNGVGFDKRYVHRLFGVFQRLHHVDDFEGTGVGLAVAQRILHRHDGRIWAEAEVGKGATFYFTLGKDNRERRD